MILFANVSIYKHYMPELSWNLGTKNLEFDQVFCAPGDFNWCLNYRHQVAILILNFKFLNFMLLNFVSNIRRI